MIKLKHLASEVREMEYFQEYAGLPYIGLEHIQSQTGNLTVNHDVIPTGLVSRFRRGHVLFGKLRPYLAKVVAPDFEGTCSTEAIVIETKSNCDPRFLRYVLLSKPILDEITLSTYGAKMPRTSWEFVGSRRVPNLPIEIQRGVADFLDRETARIDELVQAKKQLVELVRESEDAVIAAITEEGGEAAKKFASDSPPLASQNQHPIWIPLRRFVAEITNGTTAPQLEQADGLAPVSRIETISDGTINYARVGYVAYSASLSRYKLMPGDVLFSHINSLQMIGNCAFYDGSEELFLGMNLLRVRPMDFVHPKFLYWCFRNPRVQNQIQQMAKPAINQASISISNLKRIQLPYYDLSIQVEIAELLDQKTESLRLVRSKVGESIARLKELRSVLITAAVAGSIDVDTWRRQGETERLLDEFGTCAVGVS